MLSQVQNTFWANLHLGGLSFSWGLVSKLVTPSADVQAFKWGDCKKGC